MCESCSGSAGGPCQNDDIREVPHLGPIKLRHRLQYLEPGICKPLDHYCHFTHCYVLFSSLHNIEIQIRYVLEALHSRMWNGILENVKIGVQTLSQFVTGYKMYVYLGNHSFMCSGK